MIDFMNEKEIQYKSTLFMIKKFKNCVGHIDEISSEHKQASLIYAKEKEDFLYLVYVCFFPNYNIV